MKKHLFLFSRLPVLFLSFFLYLNSESITPQENNGSQELLFPQDQAETVVLNPHFLWNPQSQEVIFEIEISTDKDFKEIVDSDTIPAITGWYVCSKPLPAADYYWRACFKKNKSEKPNWIATRKLKRVDPAKKILLTPEMTEEQIRAEINKVEKDPHQYLIEFKKGRYEFKQKKHIISLESASDVVIQGNGSDFVSFEPSAAFFHISNSSRVVVSGIRYQYEPYPGSFAEITALDPQEGTMEAKVKAGFNSEKFPVMVNQMFCYAVNPENPLILHADRPGHTYLDPNKTVRIGEGIYRYKVRELHDYVDLKRLRVGDQILVLYRQFPSAYLLRSEDITFLDIENYGSEGSFVMGGGGKYIKYFGFKTKVVHHPFPGTGWVTGNDRKGPWIENCEFESCGDDAIDITGNIYLIKNQIDEKTLDIVLGPSWQDGPWKVGDRLLFWNPKTGELIQETRIQEVVLEDYGRNNKGNLISKRIKTVDPVRGISVGKEMVENTQVYNISIQNDGFVARNNRFENGRRFGINVKAINSVIEKNLFKGLASSGVYVENEPIGWEGLIGENMIIQENVFSYCAFGKVNNPQRMRGSVHVNLWRVRQKNERNDETPWMGHSNILIRNNQFIDWENGGITLDNARNCSITHNEFKNDKSIAFNKHDNTAIQIGVQTENITVEGNKFDDQREFKKIEQIKLP